MSLKRVLCGSGISLSLLLLGSGPTWASDPYADGCASYGAGNFLTAKNKFLQALKAKPKSWQAQYQLANSLLQLRETENAKLAYQKCLTMKPDAKIKAHCESAIGFITNPPRFQAAATPAPPPVQVISGASHSTPASGDSNGSADDPRSAAIAARKANVMADGKRRIDAMKAEKEQALSEGNANANHRWKNRETGERFTGMTSDERMVIEREYEDKINEIMKETRRRADSIIAP